MKTLLNKYCDVFKCHSKSLIFFFCYGFSLGFLIFSQNTFASNDLLAGTTNQALATINGSGRYWSYLIDGAISLAAFAKTKNPFVFASVLAVALGITLIYKMAGGS